MIKTDYLIIGSGIAGLTLALKTALKHSDRKIFVITKTVQNESNTRYAQGGVAAVWDLDKDSFEKHIQDTLVAGDGLCKKDIVKIVIEEGPNRVKELIEWGTRFDRDTDGGYNLGMEGGHSDHRILHYKDITGWEIQRALLEKAQSLENISISEHHFAVDLITQHHLGYTVTRVTPDIECYGAYVLNKETNEIETISALQTVLCTGGNGQIYRQTTNPVIASGDGIAMTYRANGRLENMEFVQFHPTSLFNPAGENPVFLVSEAVRGFGGILKLEDETEFMYAYDERGSLAPRDIVARAIDNEMKKWGVEHVYLDCRHLDKDKFLNHFPNIYEKCVSIGIDPMVNMIPVVPACHYMCGGVRVDEFGQSSIHNLYACGEVACTGLHGANRLASNSLLEAMVFAHRIHEVMIEKVAKVSHKEGIPDWHAKGTTEPKELVLITQSLKELKEIMSSYVGIVRSNVRLKRAMDRLWIIYTETEQLYRDSKISPQLCELRNLITIGYLVTKAAMMRHESRGLHYTTDYPDKKALVDYSIL